MASIEVLGKPLAQPRQRHALIGGHVRNYLPADHPVNGFKLEIRSKWDTPLTLNPVACEITAIFPRPQSKTKKRGPNPRLSHTSKPDCDNVAKSVCDALNGVAWKDDSQVVHLVVRKFVAAADENARTIIEITEL